MSCIFVVTPLIIGAWPVIAAAASAAAVSLGYRQVEAAAQSSVKAGPREERVALEVENVGAVAASVRADSSASFGDGRITVTVARDARGKVTVHVDGQASKAELKAAGTAFMNRLVQQYAYHAVQSHLTKTGYTVVEEKVGEDQSVRIRFRKAE